MDELIECFNHISDKRKTELIDHKLSDIIIISILAIICSADQWTEIEDFGNAKKDWLSTFLELPNGIPSHDTFNRVFRQIDPNEFHNAFIEWVKKISNLIKGQVIAIDGKTARHSGDKGVHKSALHVVSAWATENKLVLGQMKVDKKTNEITAIPELIKILDISDCIITIDAMGTQKNIAKEIVDNKAEYILALKGNQEILQEDVELYFENEVLPTAKEKLKEKKSYHKTYTKDHGRIEKREYYIETNIEWLQKKDEWKNLNSILMVISERTEGEKHSIEKRYYISSLKIGAEEIAQYQRSHWGIENSLHWVLDIAFREDENRTRKDNGAENLSILRHMAVNLLKSEKTLKRGIKTKRLKCGWDNEYLLRVLETCGTN